MLCVIIAEQEGFRESLIGHCIDFQPVWAAIWKEPVVKSVPGEVIQEGRGQKYQPWRPSSSSSTRILASVRLQGCPCQVCGVPAVRAIEPKRSSRTAQPRTPADDSMAILAAFNSPEVEVIGLTTIYGNVPTEMATRNALHLLRLAGKKEVRQRGMRRRVVARRGARPLQPCLNPRRLARILCSVADPCGPRRDHLARGRDKGAHRRLCARQ